MTPEQHEQAQAEALARIATRQSLSDSKDAAATAVELEAALTAHGVVLPAAKVRAIAIDLCKCTRRRQQMVDVEQWHEHMNEVRAAAADEEQS